MLTNSKLNLAAEDFYKGNRFCTKLQIEKIILEYFKQSIILGVLY
jgi:hypothetical protein